MLSGMVAVLLAVFGFLLQQSKTLAKLETSTEMLLKYLPETVTRIEHLIHDHEARISVIESKIKEK